MTNVERAAGLAHLDTLAEPADESVGLYLIEIERPTHSLLCMAMAPLAALAFGVLVDVLLNWR